MTPAFSGSTTRAPIQRTGRTAWARSGRQWSQESLEAAVARERRLLIAHGIAEGDLITISGQHHPHALTITLAGLALGARIHTCTPELLPRRDLLAQQGGRALVLVGVLSAYPRIRTGPGETSVQMLNGRADTPSHTTDPPGTISDYHHWPLKNALDPDLRRLNPYQVQRHILAPGALLVEAVLPLSLGLYLQF